VYIAALAELANAERWVWVINNGPRVGLGAGRRDYVRGPRTSPVLNRGHCRRYADRTV
jgi:hypothetical protein